MLPISSLLLLLFKNAEPTPRPDRISQDYKNEYPSIEVEGRTVLNKKKKEKKEAEPNNMELVKLDGEVGLELTVEKVRQVFKLS